MPPCQLKVFLILWTASMCLGMNLEARVESIGAIEGDKETLFTFTTRLLGRERLLNGSIINHVDLDESYEVWLDIDQYRNGDWVPSNMKVRTKPCNWFTNYFGKYFLPMIKDSNLPPVGEMCPFRKGEYYIRNAKIEPHNWPSILFQGLNKFIILYKKNGQVYGGLEFVIDLIDAI
ncbi:uncharacterized protein LOC108106174 [Drosophila eugracilis]|uniref:uncharacterized protein LOC108106174 n=1 Tax=Drosophila eugracilis TaxID=29029 RepID=UPI001BDB3662|nr:uncharacterized protein LOC108106174 [Drosophila eugracilis]